MGPRPADNEEEGAFVVQNVVGSSAFAADFLTVRDAIRPDICLIDAMLISTLIVATERRLPFAAINHIAWIREGACAGFLNSIIKKQTLNLPCPADRQTAYSPW